jgi:uncharacterized protein YcbX
MHWYLNLFDTQHLAVTFMTQNSLSNQTSTAKIAQLFYYPVKSCAAIETDSAMVTPYGLQNDRRWMVMDAKTGKFITQRQKAKMAALQATVINQEVLMLGIQGSEESLMVEVTKDASSSHALHNPWIWGDQPDAIDQGDLAASFLSEFLGINVRLLHIEDSQLRVVDPESAGNSDHRVGFADAFPFLIASKASISRFSEDLGYQVDMRRFRPNIVVEGVDEAYAEDTWQGIRVNGMTFHIVKPCSRCVIPSINPDTLDKEKQVIQTLLDTRKQGKETFFGQNAIVTGETCEIRVGDTVELF